MKIEFEDPYNVIEGKERRSKLLKVDSDLYKHLQLCRDKLQGNIAPKRMDFHIELIKQDEVATYELLINRAQELEGQDINEVYDWVGKAWCLITPEVSGYGKTHITIAYYNSK